MRRLLPAVLLSLVSLTGLAETGLSQSQRSTTERSPVAGLSTGDIGDGLDAGTDMVLFDVRTEAEFEVSHLQGAIRLEPDSDPQVFLAEYGDLLGKRLVVFYCSTGRRSTALAEAVSTELAVQGRASQAPANMEGGIFQWHNEKRPLYDREGITDYIHPYNWYWKRLLDRKDLARYHVERVVQP